MKRLKRGLWRGLLALALAAALGMLLGQWGDVLWKTGRALTEQPLPQAVGEQAGRSEEAAVVEILSQAQAAWATFQKADTPEVQLGVIHDPEGLEEAVRAQWSAAEGTNPEQGMPAGVMSVVQPSFSNTGLVGVALEIPETSTAPPATMRLFFRKTAGRLRLDWPALQQEKHQSLDKFLNGGEEEGIFRMGLRRRHVFGELASAAGEGAVLRIIHLEGREEPRLLVVDPQDAAWSAMENVVGWEETQAAIARLGWKRFPDGRRRLELKELRAWE